VSFVLFGSSTASIVGLDFGIDSLHQQKVVGALRRVGRKLVVAVDAVEALLLDEVGDIGCERVEGS